MKRITIFFLFLLSLTNSVLSQEDDLWVDAQILFSDGEYFKAFELYEEVLKDRPEDPAVWLEAGMCVYRMGINKQASLKYFENSLKYAPADQDTIPELFYYLGEANHLNYNFDAAAFYYKKFKKDLPGKSDFREEIDVKLKMIENAKNILANKKDWKITNLGPNINSDQPDFRPVLSLDEKVMFFTSRRLWEDELNKEWINLSNGQYFEDVYYSVKDENGKWQPAKMAAFNTIDRNEATVGISVDGSELLIYQDDQSGNGDLFIAEVEGKKIEDIEKLPKTINTKKAWETHACFSPDGKTLYFVSDKKGGYGGRDIYKSTKNAEGEWTESINLGPEINTEFDEESPFMASDGITLYFSSNSGKSMGGFDIFYSKQNKDGSGWSAPKNMGYPLNTTDDDVFFVLGADGKTGYYASSRQLAEEDQYIMNSEGGLDIYKINFDKTYIEAAAFLSGMILKSDGSPVTEGVEIEVLKKSDSNEISFFAPRKIDGGYTALLEPCDEFTINYYKEDAIIYEHNVKTECVAGLQHYYKTLILTDDNEVKEYIPPLEGTTRWKIISSPEDVNWDVIVNLNPSPQGSETTIITDNIFNLPKNKDKSRIYSFKFENKDASVAKSICIAQIDGAGDILGYAAYKSGATFTYDGNNPLPECATEDLVVNDGEKVEPAEFQTNFAYNKNQIDANSQEFKSFVAKTTAIYKSKGRVDVRIESSASKVPTQTFENNTVLAQSRANEAKELFLKKTKANGIEVSDLRFVKIDVNVSGTEYAGDYQNKSKYRKHQYVKIMVE